jgi:hypothetical protein
MQKVSYLRIYVRSNKKVTLFCVIGETLLLHVTIDVTRNAPTDFIDTTLPGDI